MRQWLEWLTRVGVLPFNAAAHVKTLRVRREEGKTPVLDREEARRLFALLNGSHGLIDLRDRAILAVMLFDFARVSAVVRMRVRDFVDGNGSTAWLLLHEKGGRERRVPAHHVVRDGIRAYLDAARLDPRTRPHHFFSRSPA